jgi:hypothetical protein
MGILQPLPDYHSTSPVSWYELPSNTIAYVYTKLPAVLFPLERIIAVTTTDRPTDRHRIRAQPSEDVRMYDRESIKGGVRRGWEKRKVARRTYRPSTCLFILSTNHHVFTYASRPVVPLHLEDRCPCSTYSHLAFHEGRICSTTG